MDKKITKIKTPNNNNIHQFNNISIIGTGAWATAIANVLSASGNNVTMYGVDTKETKVIKKNVIT